MSYVHDQMHTCCCCSSCGSRAGTGSNPASRPCAARAHASTQPPSPASRNNARIAAPPSTSASFASTTCTGVHGALPVLLVTVACSGQSVYLFINVSHACLCVTETEVHCDDISVVYTSRSCSRGAQQQRQSISRYPGRFPRSHRDLPDEGHGR